MKVGRGGRNAAPLDFFVFIHYTSFMHTLIYTKYIGKPGYQTEDNTVIFLDMLQRIDNDTAQTMFRMLGMQVDEATLESLRNVESHIFYLGGYNV